MAYTKEELAHYGIKGMKWGRRTGGIAQRFRGAIGDNAQQRASILTRQNNGTSKGIDEKISRGANIVLSGGKKRMVAKNKAEIERMKQREARTKSGKLKAGDILNGLMVSGSAFNLAISRRDNKGS